MKTKTPKSLGIRFQLDDISSGITKSRFVCIPLTRGQLKKLKLKRIDRVGDRDWWELIEPIAEVYGDGVRGEDGGEG